MEDQHKNPKELFMFYNVENLFLPDIKNSETARISGLNNWNEKKYRNKLFKICHVAELIQEQENVLPMVIGLSEIQGKQPLEDLVKMPPFSEKYGVVHFESMDERGVDVALLFDKEKLELISAEPITYIFEIQDENPANYDTTRDVLHCRLKYQEEIINFFVVHLPSKRENDINKPQRDLILKDLSKKTKEILTKNTEAVVVMGDFNENPDDENLSEITGPGALTNPFLSMFSEKIFSTFHYKEGLLFDQILHSEQFLSQDYPLKYFASEVFRNNKLSNWDRNFVGRPFRTYAGTRYLGGYSDHFPVLMKLLR